MTETRAIGVEGYVAPGFEPVRIELERNLVERGELGAAFAAMRDGEPLVDLWGGLADRASESPWCADTLVMIFSGTKGPVSVCMLMLLERGLIALDAPVARYWPEFAQAGKADVLVRDVLGHTARLPGLAAPVSWREATDSRRMAELLAAQPQSHDPRAAHSYHAMTFGWLCEELMRRTDGRDLGRFFAEEVAGPLALELWIGLPRELESRVATLECVPGWAAAPAREDDPYAWSVLANPPRRVGDRVVGNERAWRAAGVPASGAIGTARAIARFYDGLDRLLHPETLALGRRPLSTRRDVLRDCDVSFGVGFQLPVAARELGPPADAFGHGGAGGSRHGRWPSQRVAFSYAMNRLSDEPGDRRGPALLDALHRCLGEEGGR